jgi:hypothetical protein
MITDFTDDMLVACHYGGRCRGTYFLVALHQPPQGVVADEAVANDPLAAG